MSNYAESLSHLDSYISARVPVIAMRTIEQQRALRLLREASGLSQEGWAARLGDGRATVQRWELGQQVPRTAARVALIRLCQQQGLGSPALDRLVHLNNVGDLFLEEDPDFVLASDYANLVKLYQFWNLHALIGGQIEKLLDHPLLEVMAVKRRIGVVPQVNNLDRSLTAKEILLFHAEYFGVKSL